MEEGNLQAHGGADKTQLPSQGGGGSQLSYAQTDIPIDIAEVPKSTGVWPPLLAAIKAPKPSDATNKGAKLVESVIDASRDPRLARRQEMEASTSSESKEDTDSLVDVPWKIVPLESDSTKGILTRTIVNDHLIIKEVKKAKESADEPEKTTPKKKVKISISQYLGKKMPKQSSLESDTTEDSQTGVFSDEQPSEQPKWPSSSVELEFEQRLHMSVPPAQRKNVSGSDTPSSDKSSPKPMETDFKEMEEFLQSMKKHSKEEAEEIKKIIENKEYIAGGDEEQKKVQEDVQKIEKSNESGKVKETQSSPQKCKPVLSTMSTQTDQDVGCQTDLPMPDTMPTQNLPSTQMYAEVHTSTETQHGHGTTISTQAGIYAVPPLTPTVLSQLTLSVPDITPKIVAPLASNQGASIQTTHQVPSIPIEMIPLPSEATPVKSLPTRTAPVHTPPTLAATPVQRLPTPEVFMPRYPVPIQPTQTTASQGSLMSVPSTQTMTHPLPNLSERNSNMQSNPTAIRSASATPQTTTGQFESAETVQYPPHQLSTSASSIGVQSYQHDTPPRPMTEVQRLSQAEFELFQSRRHSQQRMEQRFSTEQPRTASLQPEHGASLLQANVPSLHARGQPAQPLVPLGDTKEMFSSIAASTEQDTNRTAPSVLRSIPVDSNRHITRQISAEEITEPECKPYIEEFEEASAIASPPMPRTLVPIRYIGELDQPSIKSEQENIQLSTAVTAESKTILTPTTQHISQLRNNEEQSMEENASIETKSLSSDSTKHLAPLRFAKETALPKSTPEVPPVKKSALVLSPKHFTPLRHVSDTNKKDEHKEEQLQSQPLESSHSSSLTPHLRPLQFASSTSEKPTQHLAPLRFATESSKSGKDVSELTRSVTDISPVDIDARSDSSKPLSRSALKELISELEKDMIKVTAKKLKRCFSAEMSRSHRRRGAAHLYRLSYLSRVDKYLPSEYNMDTFYKELKLFKLPHVKTLQPKSKHLRLNRTYQPKQMRHISTEDPKLPPTEGDMASQLDLYKNLAKVIGDGVQMAAFGIHRDLKIPTPQHLPLLSKFGAQPSTRESGMDSSSGQNPQEFDSLISNLCDDIEKKTDDIENLLSQRKTNVHASEKLDDLLRKYQNNPENVPSRGRLQREDERDSRRGRERRISHSSEDREKERGRTHRGSRERRRSHSSEDRSKHKKRSKRKHRSSREEHSKRSSSREHSSHRERKRSTGDHEKESRSHSISIVESSRQAGKRSYRSHGSSFERNVAKSTMSDEPVPEKNTQDDKTVDTSTKLKTQQSEGENKDKGIDTVPKDQDTTDESIEHEKDSVSKTSKANNENEPNISLALESDSTPKQPAGSKTSNTTADTRLSEVPPLSSSKIPISRSDDATVQSKQITVEDDSQPKLATPESSATSGTPLKSPSKTESSATTLKSPSTSEPSTTVSKSPSTETTASPVKSPTPAATTGVFGSSFKISFKQNINLAKNTKEKEKEQVETVKRTFDVLIGKRKGKDKSAPGRLRTIHVGEEGFTGPTKEQIKAIMQQHQAADSGDKAATAAEPPGTDNVSAPVPPVFTQTTEATKVGEAAQQNDQVKKPEGFIADVFEKEETDRSKDVLQPGAKEQTEEITSQTATPGTGVGEYGPITVTSSSLDREEVEQESSENRSTDNQKTDSSKPEDAVATISVSYISKTVLKKDKGNLPIADDKEVTGDTTVMGEYGPVTRKNDERSEEVTTGIGGQLGDITIGEYGPVVEPSTSSAEVDELNRKEMLLKANIPRQIDERSEDVTIGKYGPVVKQNTSTEAKDSTKQEGLILNTTGKADGSGQSGDVTIGEYGSVVEQIASTTETKDSTKQEGLILNTTGKTDGSGQSGDVTIGEHGSVVKPNTSAKSIKSSRQEKIDMNTAGEAGDSTIGEYGPVVLPSKSTAESNNTTQVNIPIVKDIVPADVVLGEYGQIPITYDEEKKDEIQIPLLTLINKEEPVCGVPQTVSTEASNVADNSTMIGEYVSVTGAEPVQKSDITNTKTLISEYGPVTKSVKSSISVTHSNDKSKKDENQQNVDQDIGPSSQVEKTKSKSGVALKETQPEIALEGIPQTVGHLQSTEGDKKKGNASTIDTKGDKHSSSSTSVRSASVASRVSPSKPASSRKAAEIPKYVPDPSLEDTATVIAKRSIGYLLASLMGSAPTDSQENKQPKLKDDNRQTKSTGTGKKGISASIKSSSTMKKEETRKAQRRVQDTGSVNPSESSQSKSDPSDAVVESQAADCEINMTKSTHIKDTHTDLTDTDAKTDRIDKSISVKQSSTSGKAVFPEQDEKTDSKPLERLDKGDDNSASAPETVDAGTVIGEYGTPISTASLAVISDVQNEEKSSSSKQDSEQKINIQDSVSEVLGASPGVSSDKHDEAAKQSSESEMDQNSKEMDTIITPKISEHKEETSTSGIDLAEGDTVTLEQRDQESTAIKNLILEDDAMSLTASDYFADSPKLDTVPEQEEPIVKVPITSATGSIQISTAPDVPEHKESATSCKTVDVQESDLIKADQETCETSTNLVGVVYETSATGETSMPSLATESKEEVKNKDNVSEASDTNENIDCKSEEQITETSFDKVDIQPTTDIDETLKDTTNPDNNVSLATKNIDTPGNQKTLEMDASSDTQDSEQCKPDQDAHESIPCTADQQMKVPTVNSATASNDAFVSQQTEVITAVAETMDSAIPDEEKESVSDTAAGTSQNVGIEKTTDQNTEDPIPPTSSGNQWIVTDDIGDISPIPGSDLTTQQINDNKALTNKPDDESNVASSIQCIEETGRGSEKDVNTHNIDAWIVTDEIDDGQQTPTSGISEEKGSDSTIQDEPLEASAVVKDILDETSVVCVQQVSKSSPISQQDVTSEKKETDDAKQDIGIKKKELDETTVCEETVDDSIDHQADEKSKDAEDTISISCAISSQQKKYSDSKEASEPESEEASEPCFKVASEPDSKEVSELEFKQASEPESKQASETEPEETSEPGSKVASEPDSNKSFESESKEAPELKSKEASEPDSKEASEPDSKETPEPESKEAPKPDSKKAPELKSKEASKTYFKEASEPDSKETPEPESKEASEPDSKETIEPDSKNHHQSQVVDVLETRKDGSGLQEKSLVVEQLTSCATMSEIGEYGPIRTSKSPKKEDDGSLNEKSKDNVATISARSEVEIGEYGPIGVPTMKHTPIGDEESSSKTESVVGNIDPQDGKERSNQPENIPVSGSSVTSQEIPATIQQTQSTDSSKLQTVRDDSEIEIGEYGPISRISSAKSLKSGELKELKEPEETSIISSQNVVNPVDNVEKNVVIDKDTAKPDIADASSSNKVDNNKAEGEIENQSEAGPCAEEQHSEYGSIISKRKAGYPDASVSKSNKQSEQSVNFTVDIAEFDCPISFISDADGVDVPSEFEPSINVDKAQKSASDSGVLPLHTTYSGKGPNTSNQSGSSFSVIESAKEKEHHEPDIFPGITEDQSEDDGDNEPFVDPSLEDRDSIIAKRSVALLLESIKQSDSSDMQEKVTEVQTSDHEDEPPPPGEEPDVNPQPAEVPDDNLGHSQPSGQQEEQYRPQLPFDEQKQWESQYNHPSQMPFHPHERWQAPYGHGPPPMHGPPSHQGWNPDPRMYPGPQSSWHSYGPQYSNWQPPRSGYPDQYRPAPYNGPGRAPMRPPWPYSPQNQGPPQPYQAVPPFPGHPQPYHVPQQPYPGHAYPPQAYHGTSDPYSGANQMHTEVSQPQPQAPSTQPTLTAQSQNPDSFQMPTSIADIPLPPSQPVAKPDAAVSQNQDNIPIPASISLLSNNAALKGAAEQKVTELSLSKSTSDTGTTEVKTVASTTSSISSVVETQSAASVKRPLSPLSMAIAQYMSNDPTELAPTTQDNQPQQQPKPIESSTSKTSQDSSKLTAAPPASSEPVESPKQPTLASKPPSKPTKLKLAKRGNMLAMAFRQERKMRLSKMKSTSLESAFGNEDTDSDKESAPLGTLPRHEAWKRKRTPTSQLPPTVTDKSKESDTRSLQQKEENPSNVKDTNIPQTLQVDKALHKTPQPVEEKRANEPSSSSRKSYSEKIDTSNKESSTGQSSRVSRVEEKRAIEPRSSSRKSYSEKTDTSNKESSTSHSSRVSRSGASDWVYTKKTKQASHEKSISPAVKKKYVDVASESEGRTSVHHTHKKTSKRAKDDTPDDAPHGSTSPSLSHSHHRSRSPLAKKRTQQDTSPTRRTSKSPASTKRNKPEISPSRKRSKSPSPAKRTRPETSPTRKRSKSKSPSPAKKSKPAESEGSPDQRPRHLFYVHKSDTAEDSKESVKEFLRSTGGREFNPKQPSAISSLETSRNDAWVLVNLTDLPYLHNIPNLMHLKQLQCVKFAAYKGLPELKSGKYEEMFLGGGFVIPDEQTILSCQPSEFQELCNLLRSWRQANSDDQWTIMVHSQIVVKLDSIRKNTSPATEEYVNALTCLQILNLHRKQKLVTLLQSHACDTQARQAKDYLNCTIGLQALHALEKRRCVFLSSIDSTSNVAQNFRDIGVEVCSLSRFLEKNRGRVRSSDEPGTSMQHERSSKSRLGQLK